MKLFILFVFCSFSAFANEFVVEFASVPLNIKNVAAYSVTRFDQYRSEYFDRVYSVSTQLEEADLLKELNKVQKVKKIEPVVIEFASDFSIIPANNSIFNDIYSSYQWALNNQGQSLLLDRDDITSMRIDGRPGFDLGLKAVKEKIANIKREVVVAVIDSGLDLEHPELKDRIFKNESECLKGILHFKPTVDNDQNGYIGDCMGWNFTAANEKGDHRPYDDVGHGTHIAGIIAALSDNSNGVAGVAPFVKILPIKVLKKAEGTKAAAVSSKVAKAILYAIKMKAQVINLSLGWPKALDLKYVREAFKEAYKNNIVIIAAAGNNNTYQSVFPCAYEEVICVGALTIDGTKASFSNWGGMVDIMAPGEQILSTYPITLIPNLFSIYGYEIKSGTSQASPYVAAGAAILKAIIPEASNDAIGNLLLSATKDLDLGEYWANSGLLRYDKLFDLALDPSFLVIPKLKSLDQVQLESDDVNLNFSVELTGTVLTGAKSVVKFSSVTPGIHMENVVQEVSHEENKSLVVKMNATIDSLESENHFVLDVVIETVANEKTYRRKFSKHISIVRSLNNIDVMKRVLPLTVDEKKAITFKTPDKTFYRIYSVTDKYRNQNFVSYYFTQKVETSQKLTVLSIKDQSVSKFEVIIPDALDINLVQWLDLNLDGTPDLWVRATVEEMQDDKKVKLIRYYLFDKELKALIAGLPYVNFRPVVKIDNVREMMFVAQDTAWGKLLMPIISGDGYLPPADRATNLLLTIDTRVRRRIYYYTLDKNKEFITRVLDNDRFYQDMRNKFNLRFNEIPSLMFLRPQSEKNLNKAKLEALFEVNGNVWVLNIGDNFSYKMVPTKTQSYFFKTQNLNTVVKINKSAAKNEVTYNETGVWGHLQTDYLAQWHYLDDIINDTIKISSTSYRHTRARDNIVDMMSSFIVNDVTHTFVQTKGSLVLIRQTERGEQEVFTHMIHRNSFIAGSLFTELYYPVVTKDFNPGLYVDASQLYAGHLYLIKEKADGLHIPIRYSLVLPTDCQAMNPQRVNSRESMSVLCESNGELQLNFLSF